MERANRWSWSVFVRGFLDGCIPAVAGIVVLSIFLVLFADAASAPLEIKAIGCVFALLLCASCGYRAAREALDDWRHDRASA